MELTNSTGLWIPGRPEPEAALATFLDEAASTTSANKANAAIIQNEQPM